MEKKSTFLPALQFGLLTGLAMIIFELILFLAGVSLHSSLNLIGYLIFIGGLYWGMANIREKRLEGVMTYGKAFGVGFWISFFAAILLGIFAFAYVKYINPGILDTVVSQAEDKILAAKPNISDAELQKSLDMVKMFATPVFSAVSGFFRYIIVGSIFSLIIAIFAKREDRTLA